MRVALKFSQTTGLSAGFGSRRRSLTPKTQTMYLFNEIIHLKAGKVYCLGTDKTLQFLSLSVVDLEKGDYKSAMINQTDIDNKCVPYGIFEMTPWEQICCLTEYLQ
jgi:hypothetical protein